MFTIKGMIESMVGFNYIGFVALIVALYYYISTKRTFPLIIPFLILSNFVEIFLIYYFGVIYKNNIVVYNYYNIVCILYYFYIYYLFSKDQNYVKYIKIGIVIWAAYAAYSVIYIEPYLTFYDAYVIGLICTSIMIILLLKNIIDRKVFINLKKFPLFYFSMGIIFFTVSSMPLLLFSEDLLFMINDYTINILIQLGNVFLNLGYLLTVIWAGKNEKE